MTLTNIILKHINKILIFAAGLVIGLTLISTQALEGLIIRDKTDLQITGISINISPDPSVCLEKAVCKLKINGEADSNFGVGNYKANISFYFEQSYSNGGGGFCYNFNGSGNFKVRRKGNIKFKLLGNICDVGEASFEPKQVVNGSFIINKGTKDFADIAGFGSLSGSNLESGQFVFDMISES